MGIFWQSRLKSEQKSDRPGGSTVASIADISVFEGVRKFFTGFFIYTCTRVFKGVR